MIDPFSAWLRMISARLDMQSTWFRSVETLQASHSVIGTRTDMMRTAAATPLSGDYVELARMVPEKIEAFSRSAQAVVRDSMTLHAAWSRQMHRVGMMMLAGRMPTIAETATLATQTAEYTLGAMSSGARLGKAALAPVHRTATGNARRLGRAVKR